jgi:hypothetical protein
VDEELKWLLLLVIIAFDGLFLGVVISKYFEVKRASFWAAVPGKIISSRSEARQVKKSTAGDLRSRVHDTELRNFAAVTYAFEANGAPQQGRRISLAEDVGNYQVAEKLKRYPVGAAVTVYYDRNRPSQSVLERDMPVRGFEIAILIGVLIGLGCLFLLLISDNVMAALAGLAATSPQAWGAAFCVILAVAIAVFAYGLNRKGAETRTWPSVTGVVTASDAELVKVGRQYAWWVLNRKLVRDRTTYSYSVSGVAYRSDRIRFGGQTYASFTALARRAALRYEPGAPVEVYYNPVSPTEAVLVRGAPGQWLVWIAAAAMLGLAARLGGLF